MKAFPLFFLFSVFLSLCREFSLLKLCSSGLDIISLRFQANQQEAEEEEEKELCLEYCGRDAAAAASTGNKKKHEREFKALMICVLGELTEEQVAAIEKAKLEAEAKVKSAQETPKQAAAGDDKATPATKPAGKPEDKAPEAKAPEAKK